MRLLVIGCAGQLARALVRAGSAAGHAVTALGRPGFDLADRPSIAPALAAVAPDLVVNAAAYTAVDRAEAEPEAAFRLNAEAAGWLAEAAATLDVPFVHVSTDYVFDGAGGAPYAEDAPPNPLGVYGASKLAGEDRVLAAHPRSLLLRTSWLCGAEGANFMKTMLRLATERPLLRVVGDQHGAPSFANDLAAAILRLAPGLVAARAGDPAFSLFHLTGAPHTTWHGFAEAILDRAALRGHPRPALEAITTAEYPTPARRPADSRLDCGRIGRVHGIVPADWRVALDDCLDALVGPLREGAR